MTLVIGRIAQGSLRIESDSKITDPNIVSNRNSIFSGLLKTIILHPKLCISYAGSVDTAQQAIEQVYKLNELSIDKVRKLLLEINRESNYETDFLIGALENQALLYKIAKGEIEPSNQHHWIGDTSGFNMFQKNFIPNLKSTDWKHIMEIQSQAFEEVISSGTIDSVGGFHITVHTTAKGLEYLMKMSFIGGQPISMLIEGNQSVPVMIGDAKTGAFAYSYLISSDSFQPAIGIHFPIGNFGTLYYPRFTRQILIFKDVDPFEFAKKVKDDYKLDLTGIVKNGDHMTMI
ncbi:hypothetical protein [Flavobacterium pectinovorum]|uniref:Uncharacterized protein n=1 Tax=Flavobacterium pectinovorum TaxID=29533 RepID=A0A502EPH1_9FLAO|nr:hypothetical protein [Flavobacterium pectinovorum]TPG38386.1 hypothetical protein EAH81_15755 [Flavobacterium pectinovorum]